MQGKSGVPDAGVCAVCPVRVFAALAVVGTLHVARNFNPIDSSGHRGTSTMRVYE